VLAAQQHGRGVFRVASMSKTNELPLSTNKALIARNIDYLDRTSSSVA
jgi:hypothetical protein